MNQAVYKSRVSGWSVGLQRDIPHALERARLLGPMLTVLWYTLGDAVLEEANGMRNETNEWLAYEPIAAKFEVNSDDVTNSNKFTYFVLPNILLMYCIIINYKFFHLNMQKIIGIWQNSNGNLSKALFEMKKL